MAFDNFSPDATESEAEALYALVELVRYLRSGEGCPWDREQTAESFAKYSIEEAVEFHEAAASDDDEHAAEECGDLIYTALAAVAAAEDEGRFTLADVVRMARTKLVRRHDHVFGEKKAATAEEAIESWEDIKRREKDG